MMFDINPNKDLIRFKRHGLNLTRPIEPLFFKNSRIEYVKYENNKLLMKVILHELDKNYKYELFNKIELNNIEYNLTDSEYKDDHFIWNTKKDIHFQYKERILFYTNLL